MSDQIKAALARLDEWHAARTDIINNGASPEKFERLANAESGLLALRLELKKAT